MTRPEYSLSLDQFKGLASQGNLIPIYREILADLETPVSAFTKIDHGPSAYLLESVEGGETARPDCSGLLLVRPRSILFSGSWPRTVPWQCRACRVSAVER
jgi:hypothetical protein